MFFKRLLEDARVGCLFLLALPKSFLIFSSFIGEIKLNTLLESCAQHHKTYILLVKVREAIADNDRLPMKASSQINVLTNQPTIDHGSALLTP